MKTTREIAEEIIKQVATGCWQFQSPGHLTELIAAALTQREQEVRAEEWQPIETAPKTGEAILIGHGNSVWEDEWWSPEQCWLRTAESGDHEGEIPSHWQPLPNPPPAIRHSTTQEGS